MKLRDCLKPKPNHEFVVQPHTHPEDYIYADRKDVAGVFEHPRTFLTFLNKVDVCHPRVVDETDNAGVVYLDLDDIATAASGPGGSGGAPAAGALLFAAASVAALWLGTKASIDRIGETTDQLKELKAERAELKKALEAAGATDISEEALARLHKNIRVQLAENKRNRIYLKAERIFSGYVAGTGASTVAVGTILKMPIYGSAMVTLAGTTALYVAAPIISVFATGSALHQAHRFFKSYKLAPKVEKLFEESSDRDTQAVYKLLRDRVNWTRTLSMARGASMVCLAAGAPLSIFGGPYGLGVLIPGIIGSVVAGYIDGKKLGYVPQLSWKEKLGLSSREALIQAIKSAHEEYALLASLKDDQRMRYPIGREAPYFIKYAIRGIARVHRKVAEYKGPRADQVFVDYLSKHIELGEAYIQTCMDPQLLPMLAELRDEKAILEKSRESMLPDEIMFCLLRHLIRDQLFSYFAEAVIKDRKLRKRLLKIGVISKSGAEYHVDANKLVLMLTNHQHLQPETAKLATKLFNKAQNVLFTIAKDKAHFMERQLLDFLAFQVEDDAKERKRANTLHDNRRAPEASVMPSSPTSKGSSISGPTNLPNSEGEMFNA